MIKKFFDYFKEKDKTSATPSRQRMTPGMNSQPLTLDGIKNLAFPIKDLKILSTPGQAMDAETVCKPHLKISNSIYDFTHLTMPIPVAEWFISQGFIGYPMCAVLAQNWIINRACKIPAEDATSSGWKLANVSADTEEKLQSFDKKRKIINHCENFARKCRVFGISIALFRVRSTDPLYYEKPFNIDSVVPGSYEGIKQIDPSWCSPVFDIGDTYDPASLDFYEPTFWYIGSKRYHKSHLVIIRYTEVPDVLKPTYRFGGLSLPQLIWERVYCAERCASEGPRLLLSKRLNVINTDLDEAKQDWDSFVEKNKIAAQNRDNHGFMNLGLDDKYSQHETSLADFDSVCMTEYQLLAGVAEMPSTKLIGTTPKGFNSTGDYESSVYRETLTGIQQHHINPLLNRHYPLVIRHLGLDETPEVVWNPIDTPSALETAQIGQIKAQTREIYQAMGVVSQEQSMRVIDADETLDYDFDEMKNAIAELESNGQEIPIPSPDR